jgi:hypothetical protein
MYLLDAVLSEVQNGGEKEIVTDSTEGIPVCDGLAMVLEIFLAQLWSEFVNVSHVRGSNAHGLHFKEL